MVDALFQLADRVWIFPHNPDSDAVEPNVGVVSSGALTVLVDGGNGPRHARRIQTALERLGVPPVTHVIYTHHHWDHVFGACVFGVPAIAHEVCRGLLAQSASVPWSPRYLEEQVEKNPGLQSSYSAIGRAIDDWQAFRIRLPSVTFSQTLRLHLDGLTIDLAHVGGQHAPDSIVVRVPEAGVIFLGDCFYVPPLHLRTPESTMDWPLLASLVGGAETYIHGHGEPLSKAEVIEVLAENQGPGSRPAGGPPG